MRFTGLLYAIAAAVTWGLVYTIDQKILTRVSPLALLFVDALLMAAITLPFIMFDTSVVRQLLQSGKLNLVLIFVSVALATAASFFIFAGIKILGASTVAVFEIAYPFFVILFSFLLFGSRLSLGFLAGAALIFLGSLIVVKFG